MLRGGITSTICDITNSMETSPGPIFSIYMCDVWTPVNTDRLYGEIGDVLSQAVKYVKLQIFVYSYILELFENYFIIIILLIS